VHDVVVPAEGGFSAPVFCIPGLNFSVMVSQTGCGIGSIDSNGGSDFTITETGDTSAPSPAPGSCGMPASSCEPPPGDSNVRVDVKVGDGTADTCKSGTANVVVSVPVFTTTWTHIPFQPCPDPDGMPGGTGDNTVVAFPQILDFTTDSNNADWSDLDPDGCCLAGSGPASAQDCAFAGGGPNGLGGSGVCMDLDAKTVTTAASGTIGSNGGPLYDLTFTTRLPNAVEGPEPRLNATCEDPPEINFTGTTMRCIQ